MKIELTVVAADGTTRTETVEVNRAYNFGYAGRSVAEVNAHVEELKELGFLAPSRVPTIYPIETQLIQAAEQIEVKGVNTYGEVEFALVQSKAGLLVMVASDHSDMEIETVSTPHAKTIYADVLSANAWDFSDVTDHWDQLQLFCERLGDDGWETMQAGAVATLLRPGQLIEELETRSGISDFAGTVLLSGTIAGEIRPGARAWRNTLTDPVLGRSLVAEYTVQENPLEI